MIQSLDSEPASSACCV